VPALGAGSWPWPGLQVYVLTSRPLPAGTPAEVIAVPDPAALAEALRSRDTGGDVHLVGGPRTIRAFSAIGALDRLEVVLLPVLLGTGVPLSPAGRPRWGAKPPAHRELTRPTRGEPSRRHTGSKAPNARGGKPTTRGELSLHQRGAKPLPAYFLFLNRSADAACPRAGIQGPGR
jgi:hypothetical protein